MMGLMFVEGSLRRFTFHLTTRLWADATPPTNTARTSENLKRLKMSKCPPSAAQHSNETQHARSSQFGFQSRFAWIAARCFQAPPSA